MVLSLHNKSVQDKKQRTSRGSGIIEKLYFTNQYFPYIMYTTFEIEGVQ
jgi:hypothetical protein